LQPPAGKIAVAAQSGALGYVVPEYCRRWGLGLSSFVSIGNKADINENDLLEYWEEDSRTEVVALYLESFSEPRRFLETAGRVTRRKPVIVLKAGRTASGTRAAASHTAALAGSAEAAHALLEQSGVVRVDTFQELFHATALLSMQPLPAGRRVGILSNAGGPAVLCADALETEGLLLPRFSAALQQQLRALLPWEAAVSNPVDLIASVDAVQFGACLQRLVQSDEIDAAVAIFVPRTEGSLPPTMEAIENVAAESGGRKPLVSLLMPAPQPDGAGGDRRVPVFADPESLAKALAAAAAHGERRVVPPGEPYRLPASSLGALREIADRARFQIGSAAGGWLDPIQVHEILAFLGLPAPQWRMARTAEEAIDAARELAGPVVLKVVSQTILHKSDVGGIALNVEGAAAVRAAFARISSTVENSVGVLVQEYLPAGVETLIGVTRDPAFGHLLTFGWGGVMVELLEEVCVRLHPLTAAEAACMVRGTRVWRLLQGFRGAPAADVAAVEQALLRVSALVAAIPEITEMDLNPVQVLEAGSGVCVLDCRVRLD
jgi:acyl-CoA synthetase (NDP forming)